MKFFSVIRLVWITTFVSMYSGAEVVVSYKQNSYVFEHSPHLSEVLEPIKELQSAYQPASTLFISENSELETKRQLVLSQLEKLAKKHFSLKDSILQLKDLISKWELATRTPLTIDYDLARLVEAKNPRLPSGQYILQIKPRQSTVEMFGALKQAAKLPHLPHSDASQYLESETLTQIANKDYAFVIQTDGRAIKTPVAYWNKAHQEVMPGGQIFIPFKESLFSSELTKLNHNIVTLALNRLGPND